ncbi:hypothetical protein RV18_GL002980 [Enterococcus termitis]|nr:hypothetical protein RV18_GL002980 [Enterococcus termitis]
MFQLSTHFIILSEERWCEEYFDSEYVRKSCGNALRNISKKYPEKIMEELSLGQASKEEFQIEKIIFKNKYLTHFLNNNKKG